METIAVSGTLEVTSCCVCGTKFAVPEEMIAKCRRNAGSLYCPSGHRLHWSETDADRLRKQLESERQQVQRERQRLDQARADASYWKKQQQCTKGQVTRIKNRVGNGVCPCCTRSFRNLKEHMASKHPDFRKDSHV